MCLIAYAPKDRSQIPSAHLRNAHLQNSDAWGIMFPHAGRVAIVRDITKHEDFTRAWHMVPNRIPVAAHFRFATSGAEDSSMAHPFPVLQDDQGITLAVMHNGVLSCVANDGGLSDTAVLIRDVLQPQLEAKPDLLEIPGWRKAMGAILGDDNKLCFMRDDGKVFFVNAHQGKTHKGGVWYSNEYSIEDYHTRWNRWGSWEDEYFTETTKRPDGTLTVREGTRSSAVFTEEEEERYYRSWSPGKDDKGELRAREFEDLWELNESEIYNFVATNNAEDITDAILNSMYRR